MEEFDWEERDQHTPLFVHIVGTFLFIQPVH